MIKTKVSYLVALYNKQEFIEECIDSILKENSKEIEIEVCLVDDGSTDQSLEIVQQKYLNNKYVKIESFIQNRGKNAAYNKAFEMSTGEYICIFGADDIVIPNRTKKLLDYSRRFNKSVYGDSIAFINISEDISDLLLKAKTINLQAPIRKKLSFLDNIVQNSLSGGNSLVMKLHAQKIFPIPEHLSFEDWWISYYLLKEDLVIAFNDLVSLYRIHGNNDFAKSTNRHQNRLKDYPRHLNYLNEFLKLADTQKEVEMIKKAIVLRKVYLGKRELSDLKSLSFDKTSLKILITFFLGSQLSSNINDKIHKITQ